MLVGIPFGRDLGKINFSLGLLPAMALQAGPFQDGQDLVLKFAREQKDRHKNEQAVESDFIRIILAGGANLVASSLLLIFNLSIPSKTTSQCNLDEISSISIILLSETMIGLLVISKELTEMIPNTFAA